MTAPAKRSIPVDTIHACRCLSATARAGLRGGVTTCRLCGAEFEGPPVVKPHRNAVPSSDIGTAPEIPTSPAPSLAQAARTVGAELGLLAKWYSRFYGRGMSMEPQSAGTEGRVEREDERGAEWHRAAEIHRRFESLAVGEDRRHYAVLRWVYLERAGGGHSGPADLMAELGWRFATPAQRKNWTTKRKSLASAAPRKWGEILHDQAVRAYASRCR